MNNNGKSELRHHIAQGYLRGFKKKDSPLYAYDYKKKEILEIGLQHKILAEMDFYTGSTETFLNQFETEFALYRDCKKENLKSLIENTPQKLSRIISVFFLRSKYQKNFWLDISKKQVENKIPLLIEPNENHPFLGFLSGWSPISTIPEAGELWNEIVQNTFECEIKSKNNKITSFIEDCILNNNYEIIEGDGNFLTSETPIIILDNNKPIKFEASENVENILFSLNASTRIYFYGKKYFPMTDWLDLFKELLDKKYCNFIISADKTYLINKLNKLKFQF